MQQIINFIIRFKTTLLFFLLLLISLFLTVQSHTYHRSIFFNSSNRISGSLYQTSNDISRYFELESENEDLLEHNQELLNRLFNTSGADTMELDTARARYRVTAAKVIKNSFGNRKNYITINRGSEQGIRQDMGVITAKGILGIVEACSKNYSVVQSILNTNSNINAKIKNTNNFGSLIWDARGFDRVQLEDIPRLVQLMVGDTIVTGAMSSIFPEDIPIGVISKFDLNVSKSFYQIDVDLFNDMTNIKNVYIIENMDRPEILELQSTVENDPE
ncbi:MAG: rod shape-determining protein MreC [Eudoraea sp.]|nr:rod shape-determining protein MreC [Eudoraea sp.]NNK30173.1 rod shape-determining protein MreC [Flavobacteriaceae bacterium]